jgi:hypothetical protein
MMNKAANSAAAFLANMNRESTQEAEAPRSEPAKAPPKPAAKTAEKPKAVAKSREQLKHIGGYCDAETVEMFAILRARLNMDNSEVIAEAVRELYKKHKVKRAFAD